jgi:hypothetical protein
MGVTRRHHLLRQEGKGDHSPVSLVAPSPGLSEQYYNTPLRKVRLVQDFLLDFLLYLRNLKLEPRIAARRTIARR